MSFLQGDWGVLQKSYPYYADNQGGLELYARFSPVYFDPKEIINFGEISRMHSCYIYMSSHGVLLKPIFIFRLFLLLGAVFLPWDALYYVGEKKFTGVVGEFLVFQVKEVPSNYLCFRPVKGALYSKMMCNIKPLKG